MASVAMSCNERLLSSAESLSTKFFVVRPDGSRSEIPKEFGAPDTERSVASFRAMQKKFEREREEYYETTLSNAWDGFHRPPFWT